MSSRAPTEQPAGERALATVLFTDIVGSTERAVELGDRRWRVLLEEHEALVRRQVDEHAGRVVDTAGDGVFAVFPAPAQAIRCARAICSAVRDLGLEVRAGVHTGECEVSGDRLAGLAVHVGARIGALAGPGQVLVSHTVRDLVLGSDIAFAAHGAHTLKGIPGEWQVFRARDESGEEVDIDLADGAAAGALPLPPLLAAAPGGPFVGRDEHLRRLEQQLELARAGQRRFAFVAGEAGIGKTRLTAEFARRAHRDGASVLHGRCFEEALVPYESLVDALRQYVASCPAQELRARLGRNAPELSHLVPELGEHVPGLPRPAAADAEGERFRLFEALREFLARAAQEVPLVLLLDDLHWADRPTMLVLRHLARSPQQSRLLVLGTYRDPDPGAGSVNDLLMELRRDRCAELLSLSGLDERETARLVSEHVGFEALSRDLHARTEGNPFFLEALVRHLDEVGALEGGESAPVLAATGVPRAVTDVISHRLLRLGEPARDVLVAAAIVGRDFDLGLVERVTGVGEDAAIEAVEEAGRAGLVFEVPGVVDRYSFSHALIRETLYEGLPASRRVRLHRRVAEALEQLCGDDPDARLPELAHHFSEAAAAGGDVDRAVDYGVRAAEQAMDRLAYEEAAHQYTRALAGLARKQSAEAERARLEEGLGEALSITGRHAEASDAFARALEQTAHDSWQARARLLRKRSHSLETQRRYEEALAASLAAERGLAGAPPDLECERELLQVKLDRLPLHYWQDQVDEMTALLEDAAPAVERLGTAVQRSAFATGALLMRLRRERYAIADDTLRTAENAAAAADETGDVNVMAMPRFNVGFCLLWHGDLDAAEENIREAEALARRTGNVTVASRALVYLTIVYRRRLDVDAVEELAARAGAVAEAGEMLEYVATSRANQAWVRWQRGDLDSADGLADRALEGWAALPTSFAYAFKWTALWPKIAVALARGASADARESARALLDPEQQVLPIEIVTLLENGDLEEALAAATRLGIA